MKNLFKSIMTVAVAAISLTSCSNNFAEEVVFNEKINLNITAVSDEITRSVFGEPSEGKYPTLWEGEEKFVLNVNENTGKTTESVEASFSADLRTVNLKAQLELKDAPESYTVYAMVPQSACVFAGITADKGWQVDVPTLQIAGPNSCDPAAQILVGASDTKESAAETFNMTFKHAVAYGKMTLTNLNLNGATINSVAIESEKNIAGRFYINNKTAAYTDNSPSPAITVKTSSAENIWFALAPVDVSNTVLKIVVNTDKGTLTKSVTMPANRKFEIGKISTFKVDMTGVELVSSVKYTLLTNIADLKVGDQVIIAAAKAEKAISSTQNGNNRAFAAITKNDDNTLSDPAKTVEIFVVENGVTAGTYAFNAQKHVGYIYAASSSKNYLRTQTNKDANASWNVTVTNAGIATIKATGSNTKNLLRFNSSSSLFSCYDSGQEDVVIYRLAGEEQEPDTTPQIIPAQTTITIEANVTSATVEFTLNNITGNVTVDWEADWIDAEIDSNTLYIDASENTSTEQREAVLTLSANGAVATVTLVQKGKAVDAQLITVAEFIKKGVSEDVEYILSGTITAVANTTYGNFDLTDDTGTVYIYGLVSPDGATSKYWATSKAKLGDDITIKTIRADFNGTPQGKNAKFVELVSPGTRAFYTVDPMVVDFASAGGEKVVSVTTYNTDATVSATSDNDVFTVSVSGKEVTISAAANELEEAIEGVVTINVGNLAPTKVKVTLAAKPAAGTVEGGSDDFHTISSTNTSYVSGKTTAGWNYVYCAILKGGTSDSSPAFKMIGDDSNRALCMNGKKSNVGTITSPTLTTGCGVLKFNYGLPFSDTKIKFRVDIKQNGAVVKTITVDKSSASKFTKYSHEEEVNVAGEFQIVFTNLSPSNSTSNKDRTAIWDVEWTGYNN